MMKPTHLIFLESGWKGSGKDEMGEYITKYNVECYAFADELKKDAARMYPVPLHHFHDVKLKEAPLLHMPYEIHDKWALETLPRIVGELRDYDRIPVKKDENGTPLPGSYVIKKEGGLKHSVGNTRTGNPMYWTPRALAIFHGSNMRNVDNAYWVKQVVKAIVDDHQQKPLYNIAIKDWRYRSEYTALIEALKQAFNPESGIEFKIIKIKINRFDTCPSDDPSERDLDNFDFDYVIENKGTIDEFHRNIDRMILDVADPTQCNMK